MDVFAGLTALKTSIDAAILMKNAIGNLQNAEHKFQLAELISHLSDAKVGMVQLIEENRELKEALKTKGEMHFENNVFYQYSGDQKSANPFCPTCWSVKDLAVPLQPAFESEWKCRNCTGTFDTSRKTGTPRPEIRRVRYSGFL